MSNKFLLFVILSFTLLTLANGCSKAECKISSDCSQITCSNVACIDKQCKYTPTPNCCGNGIKDTMEDRKPGNKCTCPQDYGVCEGKLQLVYGKRAVESKYLENHCENNQCTIGVPPEKVRPVTLIEERDFSFFELETTVRYNEPFDVTKDTFTFKISLKDMKDDLVLPIRFNKIILKNGELLFGEKALNIVLNGIGDSNTFNVLISSVLEKPEESGKLTYEMDYEYIRKVKDQRFDNGSYTYKEEVVRDDYQKKFTTQITFFKSGVTK